MICSVNDPCRVSNNSQSDVSLKKNHDKSKFMKRDKHWKTTMSVSKENMFSSWKNTTNTRIRWIRKKRKKKRRRTPRTKRMKMRRQNGHKREGRKEE